MLLSRDLKPFDGPPYQALRDHAVLVNRATFGFWAFDLSPGMGLLAVLGLLIR